MEIKKRQENNLKKANKNEKKRSKSPNENLKKANENGKKRSKSPNENLKRKKFNQIVDFRRYIEDLESSHKNYGDYQFNSISQICQKNNDKDDQLIDFLEQDIEMKENKEVLKDNDISLFHKSTNKNSQKNAIDDSMENDINFNTQYHSSNNEQKFDQKMINNYNKSKSDSYLKKKIKRNVIENQEENDSESLFIGDHYKIPRTSYKDLFNDSPPFNNSLFEYENKNQCSFEFDSNPSEYLINNNNIDNINNINNNSINYNINNINNNNNNNNNNINLFYINLLFQFNYKHYKQNYYKNYINYIFIEPDIISLEYIINNDNNKPMIKTLSYIMDISFENENDLKKNTKWYNF